MRLIGLVGSLSLPIFISQTSHVSAFRQKFGNPNTVLDQKCMQTRWCRPNSMSMLHSFGMGQFWLLFNTALAN